MNKFFVFGFVAVILFVGVFFNATCAAFMNRWISEAVTIAFIAFFSVSFAGKPKRSMWTLTVALGAILVCIYLLYARTRLYSFADVSWPRPFPYPDQILEWFNTKLPPEDFGENKNWEFIVTLVNSLTIVFSSISGGFFAMPFRNFSRGDLSPRSDRKNAA